MGHGNQVLYVIHVEVITETMQLDEIGRRVIGKKQKAFGILHLHMATPNCQQY